MKCIKTILVAVSSIGTAALFAVAVKNISLQKDVKLPDGFTVTAHTGCEKTKDNSLDAITLGFGYGADVVEFDLSFNEEGIAVLSHDKPVGGEVTLEEAFELISQYKNLKVNVDVKFTDDLAQVVAAAGKYGISDRYFFTGVTKDAVEAVKAAAPGVTYYLNTEIDKSRIEDEQYIAELIEEVKSVGAVGLNIHYKSCSKKMVDAFHDQGLLMSVWTVNQVRDMPKALALECDNITTRYPSKLIPMVEFIKNN